jgi:hypothetical protein
MSISTAHATGTLRSTGWDEYTYQLDYYFEPDS